MTGGFVIILLININPISLILQPRTVIRISNIRRTDDIKITNTTIGAIVTNGKLDKAMMGKVAAMAHNGYARTIRPVHTTADGDTIYAVSCGNVVTDVDVVGTIAAEVMARAIAKAVNSAVK